MELIVAVTVDVVGALVRIAELDRALRDEGRFGLGLDFRLAGAQDEEGR
jgi:hypothetical protein